MESAFTDWTHLQYSCQITASLTVHSIQIHGQVLANISNNNTHRQSRELEKKRTYQIIYSLQLAVKNSFTLNPISMWFVLALIVGITLAWLSFTPCAGWYPRQHSAGVSLQVPLLGGQNSHLFSPLLELCTYFLLLPGFFHFFARLFLYYSTLASPQPLLLLNSCFSSCGSSVFSILLKIKNLKPIHKIPSCFLSCADDAPYSVPFPHGGSAGLVLGLGAALSHCHRSLRDIHWISPQFLRSVKHLWSSGDTDLVVAARSEEGSCKQAMERCVPEAAQRALPPLPVSLSFISRSGP